MPDHLIPKAKLVDALEGQEPPPVNAHAEAPKPGGPAHHDPKAAQKQHNAEVNQGIKSPKDHMVDIGRGEEIKGRGES